MQSMTVIAGLAYSDTRSDTGSRKWTHSLFLFNLIASIGRPSGNPHRTSSIHFIITQIDPFRKVPYDWRDAAGDI